MCERHVQKVKYANCTAAPKHFITTSMLEPTNAQRGQTTAPSAKPLNVAAFALVANLGLGKIIYVAT